MRCYHAPWAVRLRRLVRCRRLVRRLLRRMCRPSQFKHCALEVQFLLTNATMAQKEEVNGETSKPKIEIQLDSTRAQPSLAAAIRRSKA